MCNVIAVAALSFILSHRTFVSSVTGGIAETQEILNFCAEHGIGAEIEVISADEIDNA